MSKCKTCPMPKDKTKIKKAVWEKGESKYSWNAAGTTKDYYFKCEVCGNEQHFLPM